MTQIEGLQRDQATEMLREALAGRTYDAAQLTVVSSQELTSAIGRRRVVQYIVEGLDPTGPAQLIAKTFSESHRARLLCAHLQALSGGPFAFGRFRVPQLLAFLREQNLVLYRACTGVPLNESIDNSDSIDGVRDAARWLARLHMSTVRLPRTFDTEREIVSTHAWAAAVGRHSPELLVPAQRLASRWATFGSPSRTWNAGADSQGLPRRAPFSLATASASSTSMRPRHGDRAFDLAHFCAYLEFAGDSGTRREAFLREYSLLTGWADDGSLARYGAYTWLKIAKQLALRSGPCRTRIA